MSSNKDTNTQTETENEYSDLNESDLDYDNSYRPWTTVIHGRSTCTANIYAIQDELISEKQDPLNSDDIAKSLHNRNLLRQTKVIQISSNRKYIFIQFNTSNIMETFCSKLLKVSGYSIQFLPDFWKRNRRVYYQYTYISFLNVPSEVEEAMTDFVRQYATVVGDPQYPVKSIAGIEYMTGLEFIESTP